MMHFAIFGSFRLQVLIVEAAIFKILLVIDDIIHRNGARQKIKEDIRVFVVLLELSVPTLNNAN